MEKKSMLVQLRIERARNRLHALTAKHENFQHPAVIKQSMVLDDLINEYNRIGEQQIKSRLDEQSTLGEKLLPGHSPL